VSVEGFSGKKEANTDKKQCVARELLHFHKTRRKKKKPKTETKKAM